MIIRQSFKLIILNIFSLFFFLISLHAEPQNPPQTTQSDIFSLDEKALKELRLAYEKRPKPLDLVFNEKIVTQYIDSLPQELREGEKKRFNIIKGAKEHIIRLFERNTMIIKEPLRLNSGRGISGTIALANENGFTVRKGKAMGKHYKWNELSFEGYTEILNQFAQKRLKVKAPLVSDEENKKFAANDYVLLTILSEWYGKYELCKKFAQKAIDLRPEIKDQINELIFK